MPGHAGRCCCWASGKPQLLDRQERIATACRAEPCDCGREAPATQSFTTGLHCACNVTSL